ncbi:hypothetical protein JAAARDRAFT_40561 [Jaapia argillacea MUCL 33604]|uniref:DUF8191 domain-containing protein n=1 Tax=Jaapia argillacea MUCL 33604 TaxID=933084 RepID=A0A067PB40_9AGAM|nr:hypothetical protein JAAARDRAFT_40561 [Jaapia argillacea MUCL 33604]
MQSQKSLKALRMLDTWKSHKIKQQQREIIKLRNALRAFIPEDDEMSKTSAEDVDPDHPMEDISLRDANLDRALAFWCDNDGVYRCSTCGWEVVEGFCSCCAAECEGYESDGKETKNPSPHSVTTDHEALNSDRRLMPRGTTPLLDVGYINFPPDYPHGDYRILLQRGATPLMCQTFHLKFEPNAGIIAYADEDIFQSFSGPGMVTGDQWKICLGRRIVLTDDDHDGAQFIEDLLDEVLYFPISSSLSERFQDRWETVLESPGVWVTRPMVAKCPEPTGVDRTEDEDDDDDATLSDQEGDDAKDDIELEYYRQLSVDDEALEIPMTDYNPKIRPNEYEGTDDEGDSKTPEGENEAPGWYQDYRGLDTAYESGKDDEKPKTKKKRRDSDDVVGSDWDSDEVLSGDEYVMHGTDGDDGEYGGGDDGEDDEEGGTDHGDEGGDDEDEQTRSSDPMPVV